MTTQAATPSPLSIDALLVRVLRVGVVAVVMWFLVPDATWKHADPGDLGIHLVKLVVALAVGATTWWLAPRLAQRARRATLPGPASTPRAWLALPFVVLGLWFAGSALADLLVLPYVAATLKVIAAASESTDRVWPGLVPHTLGIGVRFAFGLVLLLKAGRLADRVAQR
jgi:hypothetical protein